MKITNLLLAIAFFTSFTAFSQLDSIEIVPSFISSDSSETGYFLQLSVAANDVTQIGALSIVVYEQVSGNPVLSKMLTASEIVAQGLIVDGKIVILLGEAFPGEHYLITTDPQNLQMAYLERVTVEND